MLSRDIDEIIHNLMESDCWGLGCSLGVVAEVVGAGMGWENAHMADDQTLMFPSVCFFRFVSSIALKKLRA